MATLLAAALAGAPVPAPASAVAAAPTALSPESLALAAQVVDRIIPADRRIETFMAAMTAIGSQMRASALQNLTDPGLRRIVEAELDGLPGKLRPVTERHIPAIITAMTRAYAREFSTAELREIAAFARSPAGAHYLGRSSATLSDPDVAAANRDYFADAQTVQKAVVADVQQQVAAYLRAHPAAAPR